MYSKLHETIIGTGAVLSPEYEINGDVVPCTYTVTLAQFREVITKFVDVEKNNAHEKGRQYQSAIELAGREKFLAGISSS